MSSSSSFDTLDYYFVLQKGRFFVLDEPQYKTIKIPLQQDKIVTGDPEKYSIDRLIVPQDKEPLHTSIKKKICLLGDPDKHKKIVISSVEKEDAQPSQRLSNVVVELRSLYDKFYEEKKSVIYFEENNTLKYCLLDDNEDNKVFVMNDPKMIDYYKKNINNSRASLIPLFFAGSLIASSGMLLYSDWQKHT